jgi:hypothetical protein
MLLERIFDYKAFPLLLVFLVKEIKTLSQNRTRMREKLMKRRRKEGMREAVKVILSIYFSGFFLE